MSNRYILSLALMLSVAFGAMAQHADTRTRIFNPDFRTLTVRSSEGLLAQPVISKVRGNHVVVTFDEIADDFRYLQYRLVHCNADWQPSSLLESEYVEGFNIANVNDYAFSSNTFIHYVNYRIELPSADMNPLVSGNYLLEVFEENDEDNPILQVRFCVDDNLVDVRAGVTSLTDIGHNDKWQQVNVTVDAGAYRLRDPYADLTVEVIQNGRVDNSVKINRPLRVGGQEIFYDHNRALIFPAGNEFRRFETVRADYPGMGVDSTRYIGNNYHAFLKVDSQRATTPYYYDSTQFGRYLVREYNSTDSNLGADYVTTHFCLDYPEIMNADIYVDGEFTQHLFSDFNRMRYNRDRHLYELELPLKQGSYNYQYLVVPAGSETGDTTPVEGNHYETVNEYFIKVYERRPSDRADRLIGTTTIYSGK